MQPQTRRDFLRTASAAAGALTLTPWAAQAADEKVGFTLPKLPYASNALEAAIDAMTMEIHHGRHHQAYVDNLNKALAKFPALMKMSIGELMRNVQKLVPQDIRQAVINNGGGHLNHSMFWEMMAPAGKGGEPRGDLLKAIEAAFGSVDKMQAEVNDAALKRFGSGWSWLTYADGKLKVMSTANQNYPYLEGQEPLLGVDVWEHAYYLRYQNKRADYLKNWWKVVNWDYVAARYNEVTKK